MDLLMDLQTQFMRWELRWLIVLSIIFQTLRFFWPYHRRWKSSPPIKKTFWLSVYLGADFFATLSLGNIFQANVDPHASGNSTAFWAPFILLHLGGHGVYTSFSLEENGFWPRDMIRYLFHELTALFICILAYKDKQLLFPFIILFIASTLKFWERVWALRCGSVDEMRSSLCVKSDPGLNIWELADIKNGLDRSGNPHVVIDLPFEGAKDAAVQAQQHTEPQSDNETVKFLCKAYQTFERHKGLYIDINSASKERNEYRHCFHLMDTESSFRLIETDLSFAFDLFYTKTAVSHTIHGWTIRAISLASILIVILSFCNTVEHQFSTADMHVTVWLLVVALIFELVSFCEAAMSNRTLAQIGFQQGRKWRVMESAILSLRRIAPIRIEDFAEKSILVGQYSILDSCFQDYLLQSKLRQLVEWFNFKELWDNYKNTRFVHLKQEFSCSIFSQWIHQHEEKDVVDAPVHSSNLVLRNLPHDEIFSGSLERGFEEGLLIWHLATEFCYYNSKQIADDLNKAKVISDYMLYVLVMQSFMLSSDVAFERKSYRDASAALVQFFSDLNIRDNKVEAYQKLRATLSTLDDYSPHAGVNRVLLAGFRVARMLEQFGENEDVIWKKLFQTWVEMLSYAAVRCKGVHHAKRLNTGGELLTFLWVLVIHLEKADQYKYCWKSGM